MSVLIKGFEKPDHCLRCPMKGIDDECVLQGVEVCDEYEDWGQQMANCPLVPVPPLVALIDRDDFFAECPELVNGYKAITDDLVVVQAEEKEENFCADCHWYEAEEQYCFRKGCHSYDESSCELWEPMPADEPIPAPGGKTVPTTYDLLYEEGGAGPT